MVDRGDLTARLVVTGPPRLAGGDLNLTSAEVVIGHSDTADVFIDDEYVSRRHALLRTDSAGVVTIQDLGSTAGTVVNGERIEGPRVLRAGDVVEFADVVARFEPAVTAESRTADTAPTIDIKSDETKERVTDSVPGAAEAVTDVAEQEQEEGTADVGEPQGDQGSLGMDISAGLSMGTSGEDVAALHDALTVIGLQIEVGERDNQLYGASTVAAVIKLQALAGIEQTGAVDENTGVVITVALDRLGIRQGDSGFTSRAAPYVVSGTVTDSDGNPVAQAKVVAFDCELRASKEIGEGVTDQAGVYRIAYEGSELYRGMAADLRVEVQDESGKTLLSSPITFNAPRQATIDLPLGGPAHAQPSEFASVTSAVTPLLGGLSALDLEQNNEHQDLSFLAGETGIAQVRLGYWGSERGWQ